jgi:predicted ArsR family transcriptional regulator
MTQGGQPVRVDTTEAQIGRLAGALGDPTRRRVFFTVREAGDAVSKDDVATRVGIDRRLAGFHLDKLVDQGFLVAEFRRRTGRSGPGAGRPAKHYRLAEAELTVGLPERHYDLLASLLLKAASDDSGGSRQDVLDRVGHEFGYRVGLAEVAAGRTRPGQEGVDAVTEVVRLLSRYGFAAQTDAAGSTITACACPFEELAFGDPERICGLDRAIWKGMLAAFDQHATLSVAATRARGDTACVAEVVGTGE